MPKLTVYFKKNIVRSYLLEAEKVHVGRDKTNDLVIDSSKFAPVHAVIVTRGDLCAIKQLNDKFPLVINGKKTKVSNLHHGDTITAGQHDIVYITNQVMNNHERFARSTNHTVTPLPELKIKNDHIPHTVNFQIISGADIGRILHLSIPMTLLGEQGSGIVVISKRMDGYFVSTLEDIGIITLNSQPLDNKIIKLNHNDILVVGDTGMQFYLY